MKKIPVLLMLMLGSIHLLAANKNDDKDEVVKKNAVKLNLTALAFNNLGLQYERVLGPKISVACQLRYTFSQKVPLSDMISNLTDDTTVSGGLKMGGWAVTPEFRFYPRKAMKGFYLAPYLRIRNISLDVPLNYTDDNNKPQSILATGNLNSFGGGLMIGSHFNLGSAVSLDWFIIGFHFMSNSGSFKGTSTAAMSSTDQSDLVSDLQSIKDNTSWTIKKFDYNVTSTSVSIDAKYSSFGFRGFGLNLGYRF